MIQRFSILIVLAFASLFAFAQKTYVVGVGISKNRINEAPLPWCSRDIQGVANVLNAHKNCNVFVLIDENATRSHILKILERQFSKATEKDEIIFCFSGHGFDGGISTYNNEEVVFCSEVQNIMMKSKAHRKVMLVMACHSGSFAQRYFPTNDERSQFDKNSSVMFFLSSQSNESSILTWDDKYSKFFKYVIKGLKGSADYNNDKCVTARELFNYVSPNVTNEVSRVYENQHPVMWGRFPDDMIILRLK